MCVYAYICIYIRIYTHNSQGKELLNHLKDTMAHLPVEVVRGKSFVRVRNEEITKGTLVKHIMNHYNNRYLCVCLYVCMYVCMYLCGGSLSCVYVMRKSRKALWSNIS